MSLKAAGGDGATAVLSRHDWRDDETKERWSDQVRLPEEEAGYIGKWP